MPHEMATTSKKRKLGDEAPKKYYAVKDGHTRGVFVDYSECQKSTTGYKGAIFKSFTSEQDAKDYVAGKVVKTQPLPLEPAKFYGVAVGRVPGVYEDWPTAQKQILDVKGPRYKKFATREEADAFVKSGGKASMGKEALTEPAMKKARTGIKSMSSTTKGSASKQEIRINTDGSSLGNGKTGARAGVGVFFGVNDGRNVSKALEGESQTNQRAELTAILKALELSPLNKNVRIITDSQYSINCCTVWYVKWARNAWKNATGKDVMNQDLVKAIRALIDARDENGAETNFEWIKGHSNHPGNEAADRLAVAGAMSHQ